ncbi:MAG: NADP-dependent isocitrate dehydrogenase [Anaerolineaceae bacterium]|nr:NADP-dependent isocitrate dehydrogenase [Anaerolineaceae bacterium]
MSFFLPSDYSITTENTICISNGRIHTPDHPVIPFIEGDGSGPDIWRTAQRVFNATVKQAYQGKRKINWLEVFAGEKAFHRFNNWLPPETISAFETYKIGIKGPLTTPVGGGIRSLNVAMRKALDLYVCQRPVRWFEGTPSPMRHPENVNMVVFRENTEDIYTGIEFQAGAENNRQFLQILQDEFPEEYNRIRFPESSGISIKPISKQGTGRLVRAALKWALDNQRRSLTLVHKGNIMKYTEGSFRNWGYDLVEEEFASRVFTSRQWEQIKSTQGEEAANQEQKQALSSGLLWVNDIITDAAFESAITRPQDFDVLATTNLNGDYLSDALAALVGGIGIAPGANINYDSGVAIFEATHGTAPKFAGKDAVNPSSVILSGEMMLRYMGWKEAAELLITAIEAVISRRFFTFDLHHQDPQSTLVKTSQFGDELITWIQNQ